MGRRAFPLVALFISAVVVVAIFAAPPTRSAWGPLQVVHNRLVFGTFATSGAPPRVDFCGRRYYAGRQVVAGLPAGSAVIDTAPSGMPVLADLLTPAEQAQHRTNVCTMEVWVQTGPHTYLPYPLSGGP